LELFCRVARTDLHPRWDAGGFGGNQGPLQERVLLATHDRLAVEHDLLGPQAAGYSVVDDTHDLQLGVGCLCDRCRQLERRMRLWIAIESHPDPLQARFANLTHAAGRDRQRALELTEERPGILAQVHLPVGAPAPGADDEQITVLTPGHVLKGPPDKRPGLHDDSSVRRECGARFLEQRPRLLLDGLPGALVGRGQQHQRLLDDSDQHELGAGGLPEQCRQDDGVTRIRSPVHADADELGSGRRGPVKTGRPALSVVGRRGGCDNHSFDTREVIGHHAFWVIGVAGCNHANRMTTPHPAPTDAVRMFENVVVGVGNDDEAGDDAVALARELVSPRGHLTLVHVLVVAAKPAPDSAALHTAERRRRAVEELNDLSDRLNTAVRVSCVEAPSVRRGLHDFASSRHAELLVVGASRSNEVVRLILGDHTSEVLEDPPCPVAVAPAGYAARATPIHRIGIAYDGSAASARALALARSLAAERDAELSAFEAVSVPAPASDVWDVSAQADHHVEEVRRQVAALGGLAAEAESGDPADELPRYAASVDLLVLGAHTFRPVDRLLNHTTAQQVAERSASPLLVLSSNGARPDAA